MTRFRIPGLLRYVLGHPRWAPALARALWRLRRIGWWRRPPYLPIPYAPYWDFRTVTANGNSDKAPTVREVLDAARWSVRQSVGR